MIDEAQFEADLRAMEGSSARKTLGTDTVPAEREARKWPEPDAAMFHGIAGEFVRVVGPHSEADPVALLVQLLVVFGNVVGRNACRVADGARHALNLFLVLIGDTARARKGTAWSWVRHLFSIIDPAWANDRIQSGLSSGEGLIWAIRDPIEKREAVREKGRVTGEYQWVEIDAGVLDKRLVVVEPEFASVLRVMNREGNTLSTTLRQAWDSGALRTLTKNSPAKATGAHISLIAHVTVEELLRNFTDIEAGNGFGNRFLWICVRRSKLLPFGGRLEENALDEIAERFKITIHTIGRGGEFHFSHQAEQAWTQVYEVLSAGRPGLLGALLARSEAQALRLACLYAALDRTLEIGIAHLKAAFAVIEYEERSVEFVFGRRLGAPTPIEFSKRYGRMTGE
jgi:hypothetical protein